MPIDRESLYEAGLRSLQALADYHAAHLGNRNEATTRHHLINRLVHECLGWALTDAILEEHHRKERNEYTDYTFYAPRAKLLWEAKREGEYFALPTDKTAIKYRIKSLLKGNGALEAAINQASDYCHNRGIPIAGRLRQAG